MGNQYKLYMYGSTQQSNIGLVKEEYLGDNSGIISLISP